jgi:hypothetical protein
MTANARPHAPAGCPPVAAPSPGCWQEAPASLGDGLHLVAIVLLWASIPLGIFLADSNLPGAHRQPDNIVPERTYHPIEFGLGGAGCTLAILARTFSTRDQVRLVAASVPGGEEASILLLEGDLGRLVAGYPVTHRSDQTANCVYEDLPPLPADHYSVWISIPPGPLVPPSYMGEFDVTP